MLKLTRRKETAHKIKAKRCGSCDAHYEFEHDCAWCRGFGKECTTQPKGEKKQNKNGK